MNNLRSQLHHAVRRKTIGSGGTTDTTEHADKQLLALEARVGIEAWDQRFRFEEERGIHVLKHQPASHHPPNCAIRHVREIGNSLT